MSASMVNMAVHTLNWTMDTNRETATVTAKMTDVTAVACTDRFPLDTTSRAWRTCLLVSVCASRSGGRRDTLWSTVLRPIQAIFSRRMSPSREEMSCNERNPAMSRATQNAST